MVSAQIMLVKAVEARAIGQYLAKAAYLSAKIELKNKQDTYDTLYTLRQKREKELGQGKYSYIFMDEESRININISGVDVMKRLPGLDEDIAQNIMTSPFRPFSFTEELQLVDGIDNEIYDKFKDYITTDSNGSININTAPAAVLDAIGLNGDIINNFRLGPDGEEATEDNGYFETVDDAVKKFGIQGFNTGILTVKSFNFSVKVDSEIMGRKAITYIIGLAQDGTIRKWTEY